VLGWRRDTVGQADDGQEMASGISVLIWQRESSMATTLEDDPILIRFRRALDAMYGHRLDRVVLFGSRARGEANPDSDYDIAVFLKDLPDRWVEVERLAKLHVDFLDADAFIDAKPYAATAYLERTPLMREIRREGVDL
jgi:predicted nucleotidyltransferase